MVKAASVYHFKVPVLQDPVRLKLSPEQTFKSETVKPVGVGGVEVTFIIIFAASLLHAPFTQEA